MKNHKRASPSCLSCMRGGGDILRVLHLAFSARDGGDVLIKKAIPHCAREGVMREIDPPPTCASCKGGVVTC